MTSWAKPGRYLTRVRPDASPDPLQSPAVYRDRIQPGDRTAERALSAATPGSLSLDTSTFENTRLRTGRRQESARAELAAASTRSKHFGDSCYDREAPCRKIVGQKIEPPHGRCIDTIGYRISPATACPLAYR